jgi:DNA excision repair protein ERCC-6-like
MALLKRLKYEGHRTLVFSQSRVMLDMLQKALKRDKVRCSHIDGSIASAAKRQAIVERFQKDIRIGVLLLSSQVRICEMA